MKPHRFKRITQGTLSDERNAAMLVVESADGQSLAVEIMFSDLSQVVSALIDVALTAARHLPENLVAPGTDPTTKVLMPASEVNAANDAAGNRSLIFRVGILDVQIPLGEARLREYLLKALIQSG